MSSWSPNPRTRKEIDWLVEDLFSVAPEVMGIDETITGCQVVNLDPYGVGVGTLPRYILVSLRGRYHQDVFYRGGLPDLAIGDYLTVIHEREGNRYEVMGPGGSSGVIPDPAPVSAEYVVMSLDPTLTDERVLVARHWLDLTDGGAGGNATLDFLPDNPARVQSTGVVTEYATIQAAINASVNGDWVAVPPGIYVEALTLKDGVPVTELFRHTVIVRQTAGTYTVQTAGTGTFLICVHRIEMDRAFETNSGIFAVYANHTSGTFTVIADLYCRNSITTVNGAALGLGNWNTGDVNFTGDIECLSTGYYYGCYAARNNSTGTLLGRGDIYTDATDGFAYALRNNSTGTLRWWGDLDVDTWGADPARHFAIGIRTRGGTTEWHGRMDVHADWTEAKGLYASNGAGTVYMNGHIDVWGYDGTTYGIFMGAGAACTAVVTFRGTMNIMGYNQHAYGSHTDATYGDGTIWLHADIHVDGINTTRGVSNEGSGTSWHQDGGIDTINGGPIHDLYRSAGTLNVSNSRYDRGKTFGTITEMDGDKVGHHKLASVAVNEGASLVGIQDVGAYYASVHVEGALQEIGAIAPVGGAGSGAANRIAYWSDANTITSDAGLLVNAANDMLIVADAGGIGNAVATARLMFDSSGVTDYAYFQDCYVGVKTATPEVSLDVSGAIRATGLDTPVTGKYVRLAYDVGNDYGDILCFDSGLPGFKELRIRGSPVIFDSGRVSVIALVPLAQLHVDQWSGAGAIPVLLLDQGDVSEQCVKFSSDGADRDINLWTVDVTGTPKLWWDESQSAITYTLIDTAGASRVSIWDSSPVEVAYVDSGGNVDFNGHLAVGGSGVVLSNYIINASDTFTGLAGAVGAFTAFANFAPAANFATSVFGYYGGVNIWTAHTQTAGGLMGVRGSASVINTIDARNLNLFGGYFYADVNDAGVGGGVGSIASYGMVAITPYVDTGSCTDGYGMRVIQGAVGAGSITTLYGLKIDTINAGGTNHAIYSAGGDSHHAGKASIGGTVAPLAQLHVDQSSGSGAIPVLYLDQGDVSEDMIEFACTIGVGNAIEAVGGKVLTTTHFIKVTLPGALTRYIPVGTIA